MRNKSDKSPMYIQNIEKLASLFPEVIVEKSDGRGGCEKSVDLERLVGLLYGENVHAESETYGFTWVGKKDAIRSYEKEVEKELELYPHKSVRAESTGNIYIEGDNLDALKLLRREYAGRVKMIYIDPPYNTGSEFVYKDRLQKSEWCSMIYPRLLAAKDLLCEKGMMLISIDEHELSNLLSMVEEIFGAKSFDVLIWRKNGKQGNTKKISRFKTTHEYVIAVYMNKKATRLGKVKLLPNWKSDKRNADNDPRGWPTEKRK